MVYPMLRLLMLDLWLIRGWRNGTYATLWREGVRVNLATHVWIGLALALMVLLSLASVLLFSLRRVCHDVYGVPKWLARPFHNKIYRRKYEDTSGSKVTGQSTAY